MTIYVRAINENSFEVVSGAQRLRVALDIDGKATVVIMDTKETLEVHEVDGEIIALKDPATARAETIASDVLHRAARKN